MPGWLDRFTVIFAVIGFAPLALLALKNVRAVPVGFFGVAAMFAGAFWLILVPGSKGTHRAIYIGIALILAVLLVLSFQFSGDTAGQRVKWLILSCAAWMMVCTFGWQAYKDTRRDIRAQQLRAERPANPAESARQQVPMKDATGKR
jgi:hypothetical protein